MRACTNADCSEADSPDCLRESMATASMARATTARRKSSDSCPALSTNAATSQDESRTFVFFSVTVDIERPRVGGVAINCSQIVSRQLSISEEAGGCAGVAADAAFGAFGAEEVCGAESVLTGAVASGDATGAAAAFSSAAFVERSTGAPNCASGSADLT